MSCSCASRGMIQSRFVIRPLGQAAAIQADARRSAAPLVRHAELGQRMPNSAGGHRIRRHHGAAVG